MKNPVEKTTVRPNQNQFNCRGMESKGRDFSLPLMKF
jgi:hypothetical protein